MKTPRPRPESRPARPGRRLALKSSLLLGWGGLSIALPGCGGGDAEPQAAPAGAADRRRGILRGVDSGGTGAQRSYFGVQLQAVAPPVGGGVVFDTAGCVFTDGDGVPVSEGALAAGMSAQIDATAVVELDGRPTARALALQLGEELIGAVQSVNGPSASLVVWGQTVVVATDTLLDPALGTEWALLPVGTRVRVWGQLDTMRRRIVATRLDRPPPEATDLVRGVLTWLDRESGTVEIGTLRAQVAPGTDLPPPDDLAVGDVVRLKLAPAAGGGTTAVVLAAREDGLRVPDREAVELEGRVSRLVSPTTFELDGVPVDARAAVAVPAGPLLPGQRVSVSGATVDGVLVASRIERELESEDVVVELEGSIQSVDVGAGRFVVRRTSVHWTASTHFAGVGAGATALRVWRKVAVKGRRRAEDGGIDAIYVHIEA